MSADFNDIIAKLQIAGAQPPQPSFAGLQAPPDPNALAGVLQKLKQTQYLQGVGQTGGQYGYLHDAGQQALASVGQQLGTGLGGALAQVGQPPQAAQPAPYTPAPPAYLTNQDTGTAVGPQAPTPNPGATPQQTVSNMVLAATAYNKSLIASGMPADQARVTTISKMVDWGVPGAADELVKAQEAVQKNASTAAGTAKDTAQAASANDEIAHRALDDKSKVFTTRDDLSNAEYLAQQDQNGKIIMTKRSDKASLPQSPAQDAAEDAVATSVANGDMALTDALSRTGGANRYEFINRVLAKNPQYNTPDFKAKAAVIQAYAPSGPVGQQLVKMENAANHSDTLIQAGQALDNGDLPTLNKIANALGVQTGGLTTPKAVYDAIVPIYSAEVNSSLIKGGGGEQERQAREQTLSSDLPQASRQAAIQGIQGLLRNQAANMNTAYTKTSGRKDLYDTYPGLKPPDAAASTTAPAAPQTAAPASGWGTVQKSSS